MRLRAPFWILSAALTLASPASARFAETLPASTFMLDTGYIESSLHDRYDNSGQRAALIDTIDRYDPGGGFQGTLHANVDVNYRLLAPQLRYGIFDALTAVVAVPTVYRTTVRPHLSWTSGDYQWTLGRSFSEDDFWSWAGSMGQPKPGFWQGNAWTLADMILAARYRFTDHFSFFEILGIQAALTVRGSLPTGTAKDPEEIVSSGTTNWDLQFQGDLSVQLGIDKRFDGWLDDRLGIGLELSFDWLYEREFVTPTGSRNPLLLTQAPYVGPTYLIDPGDYLSLALDIDIIAIKGPVLATWLVKGDRARAASLPPLLALTLNYRFTFVGQSVFRSQSPRWDYQQGLRWQPGYKNAVGAQAVVSLLRLGSPLQLYASYRSLSLIPGKNSQATDVFTMGLRVPFRLWPAEEK